MITNTNNILPRKMLMILRIDKENTSILKSATIIQYTIKGRFMSR